MRRKDKKKMAKETSSYFELPESRKPNTEDKKEEDIRKFMGLCKNICKVNIKEESLEKASYDNKRPLLITLKEENTKKGQISKPKQNKRTRITF